MKISQKTANKIMVKFKGGSLKTMGDLNKLLRKDGYRR